MRTCCLLLFTVLCVAILTPGSTTSTVSRDINEVSLSSESINSMRKRSLREERDTIERPGVSSINDEERIGLMGAKDAVKRAIDTLKGTKDTLKVVKGAVVWLWNAVKIRLKMKFWLFRGTTPKEVFEKLKVASKTDKNYKYYSRYYFRYYVKYPSRIPTNLPKKAVDGIMKARIYDWLKKNRSPPQVFKELGFSGTFASARGTPNYEYFELYSKMWSDLQIRLSKARPPTNLPINLPTKTADEIMKAQLENWLKSNRSPQEVFKELGFTGTFASARGKPNYEYFELYSKMWSDLQVKLSKARPPTNLPTKTADEIMKGRLYDWLRNNLSPAEVFNKLGFTGTFASARGKPNYEYFELYSKMWSALQLRLSQEM